MGIPFHRGRDVEDSDTADRAWVAVISASFAEHYWPGQDPIGRTFGHQGSTRTVVGIVGDVRVRGLERSSEPQMYLPARQAPEEFPASRDPKDLVIRAVDPEQPISEVRPLGDVLARETATRRGQLQVLGVFAVVAILLSAVGIYGLLAFTVAQRSQEIGVRLALGAEPARVGRMILADGMRLAVFGIVPGMLGAYLAARGMSALLFGVAPGDPATFAIAVGVVLLMALAGTLVPALRAVRMTPMSVLRAE
jgi:putative ABC transport system permease protein